jgi:hypothetical protein
MRDKEQLKKRRDAKCRHFNGLQNKVCESKFEYPDDYEVCFGMVGGTECSGYIPFTAEELAEKSAALVRQLELLKAGLSSCCEAPFDTSHVITEGEHKNHGPRFCSKCKALCFMV